MRKRVTRDVMSSELTTAIGLVWGHLNACQFEEAYQLARGCLRVWPEEKRLIVMSAYAAVELLEPLDEKTIAVLQTENKEWAELVLRRAEYHGNPDLPPEQDMH
ncbi:MAG: hypothetical protein V7642_2378 [Burkholderiales bacterium]|jgi:hypothetical protein